MCKSQVIAIKIYIAQIRQPVVRGYRRSFSVKLHGGVFIVRKNAFKAVRLFDEFDETVRPEPVYPLFSFSGIFGGRSRFYRQIK